MERINEPSELQRKFSSLYPELVLASSSPNRRGLLECGGSIVHAFSPEIDESTDEKDPVKAMLSIAGRKLEAYMKSASFRPDLPAIAADTLVLIDNQLLGKPRDEEDAERILRTLSGRSQIVYTATGLYLPEKGAEIFIDSAEVVFYDLSDEEIRNYISTGEWNGAAGGYRLQKTGYKLVEKIIGDWTTVVGLPLEALNARLS